MRSEIKPKLLVGRNNDNRSKLLVEMPNLVVSSISPPAPLYTPRVGKLEYPHFKAPTTPLGKLVAAKSVCAHA